MNRKLPVISDAPDDLDAAPLARFAIAVGEEAPRLARAEMRTRPDYADAVVRKVLAEVLAGLRGEGPPVVGVPSAEAGAALDELLGVGDAHVEVLGRSTYRAEETTMPGVWRVRTRDEDGRVIGDHVEVADVPRVARVAAEKATSRDYVIPDQTSDLMNARPVLAEVRHRSLTHPHDAPNHVISLSLLPLTPADVGALRDALGAGPVRGGSRGYGRCNVALTARSRVWNVQYLNAMGVVVLDTLEIGDVPVALRALPQDLEDSTARLAALLDRVTEEGG